MKFNKRLIVSSLASAMGLSLVGAISGTVAWYQYSTRSTLAFVGTSVKNGANLEMKLGTGEGEFKSDIKSSDVSTYLAGLTTAQNTNLSPITTGALAKNAALPANFYTNPSYKDFEYAKWGVADAHEYVQFDITLRYKAVEDGTEVAVGTGRNKKVWLNDALFQQDAGDTTHGDLSRALRVHLHTTTAEMTVSKNGGSVNVFGQLDLNNDGVLDGTATWSEFQDNTATNYGADTGIQTAYKIGDTGAGNVVEPTNTNGVLSGGTVLGTTDDNGELVVTVTIWLEGWQPLLDSKEFADGATIPSGWYTDVACSQAAPATASGDTTCYRKVADWNENTYLGAKFDLGLEFISER